jgi:hypothetical protein
MFRILNHPCREPHLFFINLYSSTWLDFHMDKQLVALSDVNKRFPWLTRQFDQSYQVLC